MLTYLILSIFPAALLIAAANDLYEFKIPNWICLALIGAFPVAAVFVGAPPIVTVQGLLLGAGALSIGFFLFAVKFFGGGDAKLFAATVPWIGLPGLLEFFVTTAMAGMVLAFVLIAFRGTPPLPIYAQQQWLLRLHQRKHDLPYGVAIAIGGLVVYPYTPVMQLAFPS